jgi:Txe/YoeB family toxin of toxin-antitoxin system
LTIYSPSPSHELKHQQLGERDQPEPLKYGIAAAWSRRITEEHRLVYQVLGIDLVILQARYRYEK